MKNIFMNNLPELDYAGNEAFNTLATNVTFAGDKCRAIMMTSCIANEGKSFVSLNLARVLGNLGYRVVLVDSDLRNSVFVSQYGIENASQLVGITHYLAGWVAMDDIVYQSNMPNVCLIPVGKLVLNSLPLVTSDKFVALISALKGSFDFVIVDAPPVGLVIDAAMIATACDGTILVTTSDAVSRRELVEAKQQLEKSGSYILGTVLNKVAMNTHKSKKYYYKSYYSHYGDKGYGGGYGYGNENGVKSKDDEEALLAGPGRGRPGLSGSGNAPRGSKASKDADGAQGAR